MATFAEAEAALAVEVEAFQTYLQKKTTNPNTRLLYGRALRRAYLYSKDLVAILLDPELAHGSYSQIHAALGHYVKFLRARGSSFAETLQQDLDDLPRHTGTKPPPERPLSNDEWRRLEAAARQEQEPLATILTLLCTTGLRVTVDLGGLERRWVEEAAEYGTLNLRTKGGDYRQFPAQKYREQLQRLLEYDWDILWQAVTPKSKRAYYMAVRRALKRCATRAGLDAQRIHPHLLRATTATQLLKTTKDITRAQKRLGHRQLTTTQIYTAYVELEEMQADDEALEKFRREK